MFFLINYSRCVKQTKLSRFLILRMTFFFLRFQDDSDYLAAIFGGPWSNFGHYLMVKPWSANFATDQSHMSNVLIWIRLPRLPEVCTLRVC